MKGNKKRDRPRRRWMNGVKGRLKVRGLKDRWSDRLLKVRGLAIQKAKERKI